VPEGGLVIYGGFIGAAAGFTAFVRKHKLPLLAMADLVAPSFMIGLTLGRIGCFLNGCCYGGETDLPWAVTFPEYASRLELKRDVDDRRFSPPYADQASRGEMHGFRLDSNAEGETVVTRVDSNSAAARAGLRAGDAIVAIDAVPIKSSNDARNLVFQHFLAGRALRLKLRDGKTVEIAPDAMPARSWPVHPTQLYSAIDAGLLGWLMWAYYPMRRRDGVLVALMLTIHPITRFLLEIIRTDEQAVFGTGMSISQNVSLVLLACGGALWWYLLRKPRGVVWPLAAEAASPKVGRGTARVRAT
jgi:phosphatidylglycerol:prolipoprotein diacylglycerol transferase